MSTTSQFADPLPPLRPAPSMARRHETAGASVSETYGGEKLPVLIRLPDLSRAAIVPLPTAVESELGEAAQAESDPAPAAEPGPQLGAAKTPSQYLRHQRQERTIRRPRTKGNTADRGTAGWLRGVGQLAMAAILAGVLLVIVITIKHWNADNARPRPAVSVPFADAPEPDFRGPILEPAANFQPDQGSQRGWPSAGSQSGTLRGILPAENSSPSLSDGLRPTGAADTGSRLTRSVDAREIPRATMSASPFVIAYPSTGVTEPVSMSPGASSAGDAAGWSETLPVGQTRNAARPQTDPRTQR